MAFDCRRYGVHAGLDFAAGGDGRFGVSVRGLEGSAAGSGGEIELSGVGAGAHGTAFLGGGFHVDAQATWHDVKLTSGRMVVKDGAKGRGLALGVEAGRRMGGGLTVTPVAGLSWSEVDLGFARSVNEHASAEDARSLAGRAGLRVEMEAGFRLFGSAETTREFADRRSARISGEQAASLPVKTTEAKKTGFRLEAGGSHGWGDGRYALRAAPDTPPAATARSTAKSASRCASENDGGARARRRPPPRPSLRGGCACGARARRRRVRAFRRHARRRGARGGVGPVSSVGMRRRTDAGPPLPLQLAACVQAAARRRGCGAPPRQPGLSFPDPVGRAGRAIPGVPDGRRANGKMAQRQRLRQGGVDDLICNDISLHKSYEEDRK